MSKVDLKKAHAFLQGDHHTLDKLFSKVRELEIANQCILPLLPESQRQLCQVANIYSDTLILFVSNAALATQLRMNTREYLMKLKSIPALQQIRHLQIKVRPALMHGNSRSTHKERGKMALLSREAANLVETIADGIADPKLKASLKRIAKHTK